MIPFLFITWVLVSYLVYGIKPEDLWAISTGPFVIKPQLSFGEAFTDNANRGDGKIIPKESEWITFVSPGLIIDAGHEQGIIQSQLKYNLRSLFYAEHSDYNATDHSISGNIIARGARVRSITTGNANFASSISTGLEEFFYEQRLVYLKKERTIYSFSERVEWDFSAKTDFYMRAHIGGNDYASKTGYLDRFRWEIGGGSGYQITAKYRLFGDLYYGEESVSPNGLPIKNLPDLTIIGMNIGINGEIFPKVHGNAQIGYATSEFEYGAEGPDTVTGAISLSWRPLDRTTISISFSRNLGASVTRALEGIVTSYSSVKVTQLIGVKYPVMLELEGRYGVNEYTGFYRGRSDTYASASLGAGYKINRWWTIMGYYEFESREGIWRDYDVHLIVASMKFGF